MQSAAAMDSDRIRGSVCPACRQGGCRTYAESSGDRYRQIAIPFCFFLCPRCGLRFQQVEPGLAKRLYAEIQEAPGRTDTSPRREARFEQEVLDHAMRLTRIQRVLDVGSGDGYLLQAAVARGLVAVGVDVSSDLAEVARARSGAQVLIGELPELGLADGSFDLVNLDVVLMYVPDPVRMMASIGRILRQGGVLRIREYDPESLLARSRGPRYWMYAPTHVGVWPRRAIERLANEQGFDVAAVVHGSEASLRTWLASARRSGVAARIKDVVSFGARRLAVGRWAVAADTSYYLIKR